MPKTLRMSNNERQTHKRMQHNALWSKYITVNNKCRACECHCLWTVRDSISRQAMCN